MGREIRWEFVEVWFRNRLGNAQHFFPHRGRLFCFWHAASWAATFCGIGTRRRSCLHDGWNYSGECLRCLRAGLTVIGLVLLRSSNEARSPSRLLLPIPKKGGASPAFTARIERPLFHREGSASKKDGWLLPYPPVRRATGASSTYNEQHHSSTMDLQEVTHGGKSDRSQTA